MDELAKNLLFIHDTTLVQAANTPTLTTTHRLSSTANTSITTATLPFTFTPFVTLRAACILLTGTSPPDTILVVSTTMQAPPTTPIASPAERQWWSWVKVALVALAAVVGGLFLLGSLQDRRMK